MAGRAILAEGTQWTQASGWGELLSDTRQPCGEEHDRRLSGGDES